MIIAIASGKGGTGKTTLATNLALSLDNVQLLDCDVEAPNTHLFLNPKINQKEDVSVLVPKVDLSTCTFCGTCAKICAFNAIAVVNKQVILSEEICHSCGACVELCPSKAISECPRTIGTIESGQQASLTYVQGKLNVGEVIATPVIKAVKQKIDHTKIVILDAPPGTSCPVIETLQAVDFCLLVTEPTPFGLHDLDLAVQVLETLQIPCGVVVNRSDMGDLSVQHYCTEKQIPILLKIPFQTEIAKSYAEGIPLIDVLPHYRKIFRDLFKAIKGKK